MLQLVQSSLFEECPNIKTIVNHAGAMIPFFAGRIDNIVKDKKDDFKKFYVDTAILINIKALELAIDYFGIDRVLYGTYAPFGILPNGATKEIEEAINLLPIAELRNKYELKMRVEKFTECE